MLHRKGQRADPASPYLWVHRPLPTVWKGGDKGNGQWGNLLKLPQPGDPQSHVPSVLCSLEMGDRTSLRGLPPKPLTPVQSREKQTRPHRGLRQHLPGASHSCQGHQEQGRCDRRPQPRGTQGSVATECPTVSWMGPWNRKATCGNNVGNLSDTWTPRNGDTGAVFT